MLLLGLTHAFAAASQPVLLACPALTKAFFTRDTLLPYSRAKSESGILCIPNGIRADSELHLEILVGLVVKMGKQRWPGLLASMVSESGLNPAPGLLRDRYFWLALVAGIATVWLFRERLSLLATNLEFSWPLVLSLVIWQPLVEEILFRGVVQGQLVKTHWGARSYAGMTVANIVSSLAFAAVHIVNNDALLASSVLLPSLLYGYFRDRFTSCLPSIALHCAYNGMVYVACLLLAN